MTGELRLTVPVIRVLAALLADPGAPRYGLDLMRATELASGSLYPILTRLRAAGWVETHWEEIDPTAAGRPARRYYLLTAEGVERARGALAALHAQTRTPQPGSSRPATAQRATRRLAW
jgi:DNA-binding PadR family transcriptional regulator